ncbi:hypothetical protein BKA64DRAFT_772062 [Cadophora sp. MPI-SDFR-AT-0126]|nr:hypothetical protein BKA64DRAFT_772062 [Leotiomycetes sp. MPI-SDFR-AT-0126]
MPFGKFENFTNTFVMDSGSFPKWWAPTSVKSTPCQRISSLYLTCGCIHSSITHSKPCVHLPVTATRYLDPVESFQLCENFEVVWAIEDQECNTCKAFRYLSPLAPPPQPNWQKIIPMIQPLTMQMIYEREISFQESKAEEAAKEAVRQRHSEIKAAWEDHVLRLVERGVLDQQPNVRAVEDVIIYDLRILRQSNGELKIVTRCENEDASDGREKEVYSAKMIVELISDRYFDRQKIITPFAKSPVNHDRTKCMVCFSHPGWCSSVSEEETVTPVSITPENPQKSKHDNAGVATPVWRDWGPLFGIYWTAGVSREGQWGES